jgi:hypothetical protein
MDNEIKDFQTTDLVLASTLSTLHYPLKKYIPHATDPKRFYFVFAGDDSIGDLVAQFNSDKILIEPKRFVYYYQKIKREVFDLREDVQKGVPSESVT